MCAIIPDSISDLKQYYLKIIYSILKNILILKYANYSYITNVLTEEATRFSLLIGLPIAMQDPKNIEHNISKMRKNIIGYGKGFREDLLKLVLEIRKNTTNYFSKEEISCIF